MSTVLRLIKLVRFLASFLCTRGYTVWSTQLISHVNQDSGDTVTLIYRLLGPVVRKQINANARLKVNRCFHLAR